MCRSARRRTRCSSGSATLLDRLPAGGLVEGWVTLVGHDLMSDELVAGASELARGRGVGLTFHMSPHDRRSDQLSRSAPAAVPSCISTQLGVLGAHVLVAHAVHLDDDELDVVVRTDTAVASCPWAYLRLAQGFTVAGRHGELLARGARLALGCDAENAGDAVDILRAAALFVGLVRDRAVDPFGLTAHDGLALATIGGARAIGKGDQRSARSKSASRPTWSCTTAAVRSSFRAAPTPCCSSCGRATDDRCATS